MRSNRVITPEHIRNVGTDVLISQLQMALRAQADHAGLSSDINDLYRRTASDLEAVKAFYRNAMDDIVTEIIVSGRNH
jgi:hypothetical protein